MQKALLASATLLALGIGSAHAQYSSYGPQGQGGYGGQNSANWGGGNWYGNNAGATNTYGSSHYYGGGAGNGPVGTVNSCQGRAPADCYPGVPPTSAYQGGANAPFSRSASNINAYNTDSNIAPRLPQPNAYGNSPQAYLHAAQRALAQGDTGQAQAALERALTRVLNGAVPTGMSVNDILNSPLVQAMTAARQALAFNDVASSQAAVAQALNILGG